MVYFIFLIVGIIVCDTSGLNLNCTNDYETLVFCHTDARNCTELRMTFHDTEQPAGMCVFDPCAGGCCCKWIDDTAVILGNEFVAEVYENGQSVYRQPIKIYETIKPQTPTILSVDKLNNIYQIKWKTNAKRSIRDELSATVTYWKKGDTFKNISIVKPSTVEDMNIYEILGRTLEANTDYVVSVRTYTLFNVYSDSSQEMEFTTDLSQNGLFIAAIIVLCVIAIVISGVSFASFIKLKGKLWDGAAMVEKPNPLNIKPKKEVILTPEFLSVYPLTVEPLIPYSSLMLSEESLCDSSGRSGQSSGMSSASSSLDYANTEPADIEARVLGALKNAFPMFIPSTDTPEYRDPKENCVKTTACPVIFENKSYIFTQCPKTTDDADRQVTGDSGYHSSDAPPLQDFFIPPHVLTIDQPCTLSEDACNGLSPASHSFLPVVYGYQAFEEVEPSNNVLLEHTSDCQSLSFLTGLTNILKTSEVGHFEVGIPHVSDEIIVDPGYHCV
ncbi:hypothetical protein NQD34_001869 [Periophthalmus magnuspinnatus]|nr:hypothetical protein NQD34_001869 [Periophthalmus magnuspinnatus]